MPFKCFRKMASQSDDSQRKKIKLNANETAADTVYMQLLLLEQLQCAQLKQITFAPAVRYIYDPILHAQDLHIKFLEKYLDGHKPIMFLGMNPGPWGMVQTGVPFGEVTAVRNWLKISGDVQKPEEEHPSRPVLGLNCERKEVSGQRIWTFFENLCCEPEVLFKHCWIHNYCPLAFLGESGKNITPPDMKSNQRKLLEQVCDRALCDAVKILQTKTIIGVGRFAESRAKAALKTGSVEGVKVVQIMHPSPRNPQANKNWTAIATKQLTDIGVYDLMKKT